MKLLIIGSGSIGTRHIRNILNLGYDDITVISRSGVLKEEFSHLKVFTNIADAVKGNVFDAAVICTPTAQHSSDLNDLLQGGIKLIYVEKPISNVLREVVKLKEKAEQMGAKIIVGYDLHFDPGLLKVKQLIAEKTIGTVLSANALVGQYLPDWRPDQDYTLGMSAKIASGGGVMLDLIHEFDYLIWLLGSVDNVACKYQHSGALQIETEDVCDVLLHFSSGAVATIHLDYLQRKLVRQCMFTGTEGTIWWNLSESKVTWINAEKKEFTFTYESFNRNDRFVEIIKAFLENKDDERLTDFKSGMESLQILLAARYSSERNNFVAPKWLSSHNILE